MEAAEARTEKPELPSSNGDSSVDPTQTSEEKDKGYHDLGDMMNYENEKLEEVVDGGVEEHIIFGPDPSEPKKLSELRLKYQQLTLGIYAEEIAKNRKKTLAAAQKRLKNRRKVALQRGRTSLRRSDSESRPSRHSCPEYEDF